MRRLGKGARPASAGSVGRQVLSLLVAAVFLLPLVWLVSASLRQTGLPPPRTVEWIPVGATVDNYADVFALLPFGRYLANSLIVVALAVPLTIVTASMAGFAMAQLEARTRGWLVLLSLVLLMVPVTAIWLTRFLVLRSVGLVDTLAAIVLPALMGSSPLYVLLYYWTFRRLSLDLVETARLEGAGPFTAWWRIGLPLALPTSVAVAMLSFLQYWSDYIDPLLFLRSQDLFTLPLGLRQLQMLDRSDWPLLMAGAVILAAPAVAVFVVVQRRFLGEERLRGISLE